MTESKTTTKPPTDVEIMTKLLNCVEMIHDGLRPYARSEEANDLLWEIAQNLTARTKAAL